MRRRWFGVFLMAWALIAPLLALPAPALAAGETYTFSSVGGVSTIIGTGFTGSPLGIYFKPTGSTYTGTGTATFGSPAPTFVISGLTKDTTVGGYKATIKTIPSSYFPQPTAAIHIDDPKSLGPGGGSPPITPPPAGGGSGGTSTADAPTTCDAGPGFTWIICGIIKQIVGENGIVNAIRDNIIVPFLKVKPYTATGENATAYKIWGSFRNVSSVFFILVFFFIIIGTAVGFDNYTIKKVLPHLIAGAILIPFSWYLCAFVIDIGNVLGQGIVALISPIIGTTTIDLDTNWGGFFGISPASVGVTVVGFALIYAGAATAGLGAAITILLAFLGVFLTLIMRQILITLLVVMSPFALLAWILPNTEKWFKMWWQNFFKLVMMYPIIMLLFEAGRLFANTAGASTTTGTENWVKPLVQVTALMLPLFAVPFAFKFAGSGLAMAGSAVNRVTGAADKRYGKDSSFANDLKEGRARKNFNAAQNAKTDAIDAHGLRKIGLQRKAAFQMRRAGLSGTTGSAELRRQAATPKLSGELDAIDGAKVASRELTPEDWSRRRASGTRKFVNERATARGEREGLLLGYEGSDRPPASTMQEATRYKTRDAYIAGSGVNDSLVADEKLNERERDSGSGAYVSSDTKLAAAREKGASDAVEARSAALGIVKGGAEAEGIIREETGLGAADAHDLRLRTLGQAKTNLQMAATVTAQQTANTNVTANMELDQKQITDGHATTPAEARSLRLKNLSAATHTQEREKLGLAEGQIDEQNSLTAAAGQESMGGLVAGGQLAARKQLATARSQRTAAYQALQSGTAATTSETLDAATYQAGRATAKADADIKGIAGTVNKQIEAEARAVQAKAQARGATLPPALALSRAADNVRARNLGATAQVERAAAESRTATEISSDIGGAKTLNAEISAEVGRVKVAARADGKTLTQDQAQAQAEINVRARQISAASDAAESQGSVKLAAERDQARGVQDSLQSQEVEEAARLRAIPGSNLTKEQAAAQAKTNVAQKNIKNAGTVFRQKASRDDKDATAATTGTANELSAAIATESKLSKVGTQQAARNVRARDLKDVGVNATDASVRKASADRGTSIGTSRAIEAEIQGQIPAEVDRIQEAATAAGAALPPSLALSRATAAATAAVTARNINSASRAAQITAQGVRTKAPRTERGTIETYDAAIEAAQNKPTTDAKNAAYQAEFDRAQKAEGLKAKAQVEKDGPQLAADARTKAIAALGASATAAAKTAAGDAAHQEVIARIPALAKQAQTQAEESIGKIEGDKAGRLAASAPALVQDALPRDQAEQNLIRSIGVAAEESSMRAESATQGQVEALNQAVGSGGLDASARLSVQTEGAIAQLAAESAASQARFDLTSSGQPLNRSYQMAESMAKSVQREQILRARVAEESKGAFSWKDNNGNDIISDTIQGAPLSEEAIAAMGKEIGQLMSTEGGKQPQTARAIALMSRLKQSSPGMEELRRVNVDVFGGTDNDTVDPTLFGGEAKTIWDIGVEGAKADDLHIPRIAIYDGVPPSDFAPMDWRSKRDYLKFIKRNGAANPKVEREAAENIFNFVADPRLASKLDEDQYKAMGMYLDPPAGSSAERIERAVQLKAKITALHGKFGDDEVTGAEVLDRLKQKYDTLKSDPKWIAKVARRAGRELDDYDDNPT